MEPKQFPDREAGECHNQGGKPAQKRAFLGLVSRTDRIGDPPSSAPTRPRDGGGCSRTIRTVWTCGRAL